MPITPEAFDTCAVLAYGPGAHSTDRHFSSDAFSNLAIPELVVYKDGLVIFACRDEPWPGICQNRIAPARVTQLLDDLVAVGFFDEEWRDYPDIRLGPRTYYLMMVQASIPGRAAISWSSASFGEGNQQPHLQPLNSALAVVDSFIEEVEIGKLLYEPSHVGLWIEVFDQCPGYYWCNDVDSLPTWPFSFSSYFHFDKDCRWLEVPQTVSDVKSAMPDFDKRSPVDIYGFRDEKALVRVEVRPYLPGEAIQVMCVFERWEAVGPPSYTLPFCSGADDVVEP
jgi:hypothetical protein